MEPRISGAGVEIAVDPQILPSMSGHGGEVAMEEKTSLHIENHSGVETGKVKIKIPGILLYVLPLVFLVVLLCFGWVIHDYARLMAIASENPRLKAELAKSEENITFQRQQIQLFAGNINALKKHIETLTAFEEKVRVSANLQSHTESGIFGLGGSHLEDLDMHIDFSESYSGLMREMRERIDTLEQVAEEHMGDVSALLTALEEKRTFLASAPSIRPTEGRVSSKFGSRISPITGRREFHSGLDIANHSGASVIATADGVVCFVGVRGGYGRVVEIDHGHGVMTRYGHLSKALVTRGRQVKRGDVIGKIGSTGRSTGPHLHYEVRRDGVAVNPVKYIFN